MISSFEDTVDFVAEHNMNGCIVSPLDILSYVYQKDIRVVIDLFTEAVAKKAEDRVRSKVQGIHDE